MAVMVDRLLQKLRARGRDEETDPQLLRFYQQLLKVESDALKHLGKPEVTLNREIAQKRLDEGLPLLQFDELSLNWAYLKEVFAAVRDIFARHKNLFTRSPGSYASSQAHFTLPWFKKAARAWFNGLEVSFKGNTDSANYLLGEILGATFRPLLASYRKALVGWVEQENWRHRYCPFCGGSADFAFLDEERGSRWLVCSRCDGQWLFKRLECPSCGTQNQNSLSYFTDEEGKYRLYVCEECKRYLKAIDLRQSKSEFLPALERLFTLDVDRGAQGKGYYPCGRLDIKH